MALMDFDLQETWEALYAAQIGDQTVHYTRAAKGAYYGHDHFNLATTSWIWLRGLRIVVVGAGFGWGAEDWAAAGMGPIICTDTSAWIQANKGAEATLPILSADVLTPEGRAEIGLADVVITEDVLPCLSDADALALAEACRLVAPVVVHWVTAFEAAGGPLNWKSLEGWKALVGPDLVARRGSGELI